MIPDAPLFVRDALVSRGGLAEGELVLVPDDIARTLGTPEELSLDDIALGSPLLDALVKSSREACPIAAATLDLPPPRASHAVALAGRFGLRNAVFETAGARAAEATYVAMFFAFVAEADDRHEGIVQVVFDEGASRAPDAHFSESLHALGDGQLLIAQSHDQGVSDLAARVLGQAAHRAARAKASELSLLVDRRYARDHARIGEYFASLIQEAKSPKRKQDPKAIAAKVEHFAAERDKKLHELAERFTLRVTLRPAAALVVKVGSVVVDLQVRRRKASGTLSLHLPTGAHALDALLCAACATPTTRPAVCDERLHPLCEACVPSATGRPDCAACRAAAKGA